MTKGRPSFYNFLLRSLICLLGLLSWITWSPVAQAEPAKAQASPAKKTVVVPKRRVTHTFVVSKRKVSSPTVVIAPKASFGQMAGLHGWPDNLNLKSSVALVVDQETNEVLFSKNDQAVLPIASLTKLMTGLIISEGNLPMDKKISITQDDVDTEKGSSSCMNVAT